jgi:hypothetical protein
MNGLKFKKLFLRQCKFKLKNRFVDEDDNGRITFVAEVLAFEFNANAKANFRRKIWVAKYRNVGKAQQARLIW